MDRDRGVRQVLCRAWLGPRDQVNSRPSSWPQRRPDFLSVLGRVSRDCCSATKRPRSSATRRQVVRQSALVICVVRSQSAKHVLSHSAMRASIVWSGRCAGVPGSWPIRRDRFNNHCKYDRNGRGGLVNRSHRNRSDDGNQVGIEVDHFGNVPRRQSTARRRYWHKGEAFGAAAFPSGM